MAMLVEGMARVCQSDGTSLTVGDIVYIREIPNMSGHVVVLRNGYPPMVGYHLERFELLDSTWEPTHRVVGERAELAWDRVETRKDFARFCKELAHDYPTGWSNDSLLSFLESLWEMSESLEDPDVREFLKAPSAERWKTFAWLLANARHSPKGSRVP